MPIHVMSDLETWSTSNDALPVSIGAVKFDGSHILDRFHVGIDPRSARGLGFDIDPDTVLWWMSKDRREALDQWLDLPKLDMLSAVAGWADWVAGPLLTADGEVPFPGDPVAAPLGAHWGNGAVFDNVILRSACRKLQGEYPFKFYQDHCYRSFKAYAPDVAFERIGTHHNTVDDAESQAVHLQRIFRNLGLEL